MRALDIVSLVLIGVIAAWAHGDLDGRRAFGALVILAPVWFVGYVGLRFTLRAAFAAWIAKAFFRK